ncbi:MAG: hypothetical protein AB1521_14915 [Bacteroidota bacterium]
MKGFTLLIFLFVCLLNTDNYAQYIMDFSTDTTQGFVVETIENLSIEEFKQKIGSCDYPIEFKIYKHSSFFKGSVLFEKLGEIEIDTTCNYDSCFFVNTGNRLENVTFIVFNNLEFTDSSLLGFYSCGSPLGDNPAHKFVAKKKNIVGVNDGSEFIPTDIELFQNYPNPFNPSTTITYVIPTSPFNTSPYQGEGNGERFVMLKVYDILGREVTTLVNEYQQPGVYKVNFSAKGGSASGGDANKLTSGVYIYKIRVYSPRRAGKYVESKKMILAK